ncbi:MAG: hypothetical protein M1824_004297 [Vezdaea acicularis]|nr:MAG: hypothetical protein M1824_004297 [Vezdaea acicularis]
MTSLAPNQPCWLTLPATSVPRAKTFYETAFSWTFKPSPADGYYNAERIAMMEFSGTGSLGGGIVKEDGNFVKAGAGGVVVYLMVEDIAGAIRKVEEAGGKKVGEVTPEGEHGEMAHFVDTEGNTLGVYQMKAQPS